MSSREIPSPSSISGRHPLVPITAMLMVLLICLVTAGLSVLTPTAAQAQAQAQTEEDAEDAAAEGDGDGEDGEAPKEKAIGKYIYIKLEPLISPVLDERSIRGKITLRLRLHLKKIELEEKVRHRIPKLNDAYLNYMYRYGSSAASTGIMQLESVLKVLQRLTDKVIGKDVAEILIDEITRTRSG